jgi:hypothetical protein
MPNFTKKTASSSSSDKSLSQILNEFDFTDSSLYSFSNEELETWISELQTSTSARSPEEIDKINTTKFNSAMQSMQFASLASDKAVLSNDEVKESDKITDGASAELVKSATKASVVFAFVHGNVTNKKCWIRVSHSEKEKSKFVSFPLLNSVGSRSVLVHVYRDDISKFLDQGKDNTLTTVLQKANIQVKKEKRKYLFPKGHLLSKNKDEINAIREDLNHIFSQMQLPVEKRKFELKWFTK